MRRGDFDVAMSGVTWLPERAVIGRSSRAVAAGGPCVVGDPGSSAIAVNRGGRLERWARGRFAADAILPIDDNLALPALLEGGAAGAFVTDSFELRSRPLADVPVHCEPPTERKIYWIAPARATELGPRIDAWLAANEPAIDALRRRWLGGSAPRDAIDDVLDRIARRLEMMPAVAAAKHARGLAIEDRERETRVLEHARDAARAHGLDAQSIESLFRVQIALAKAIEGRAQTSGAPALDLESELRPALLAMSDDIVVRLAASAPISETELRGERLALLRPLLQEDEIMALRRAIAAVARASR
jgi:chorismate mutase-like protein